MPNPALDHVIVELVKEQPQSVGQFVRTLRRITNASKMMPPNKADVLAAYNRLRDNGTIKQSKLIEHYLLKRQVRTMSGVAVVTNLTKPFPCPGRCVYCPTEPNMPKSYLSNEPAAMRAVMHKFDPYDQTAQRIAALEFNGHRADKIELIILGGTWSSYPRKYQEEYIKACYDATNHAQFPPDAIPDNYRTTTLEEAQKINETAPHRIIGLCLETRPDYINKEELQWMRRLGCTRVQIGAQHLDDAVLDLIKRGHHRQQLIDATRLCRDAGFKIDYHFMLNLPGSDLQADYDMVKEGFTNDDFKPDQAKLYPTIVNEYAELHQWYLDGRWHSYTDDELANLLVRIKQEVIPPWTRLNRVIRDIPGESIVAGNKITNLRQILQDRGVRCLCIRCREARTRVQDIQDAVLTTYKYRAAHGWEYFLSYTSPDESILYAFVRLRLPDNVTTPHFIPELQGAALVRELHTYGKMVPIDTQDTSAVQHMGFGTKLMNMAEDIAAEAGYKKMATIAGVGVREYYRKLGYELEGTYMVKTLVVDRES